MTEHNYDYLSVSDVEQIHEEYRRRMLVESLIGPLVSTFFHILLILMLAIFVTDKIQEPVNEISVSMEEIEEVKIEKEPIVEEPNPENLQESETNNPILTTIIKENEKIQLAKAELAVKPKKKLKVDNNTILYCVENEISEKLADFKEEYINKETHFFYSASIGDVCIQPYTKTSFKEYQDH